MEKKKRFPESCSQAATVCEALRETPPRSKVCSTTGKKTLNPAALIQSYLKNVDMNRKHNLNAQ